MLQVPFPEWIPALGLHVNAKVENLLASFFRPAHATAFEPVSDDGFGRRRHRPTGDDQTGRLVGGIIHLVPVVTKVAHLAGHLTIALRALLEFAPVIGQRAQQTIRRTLLMAQFVAPRCKPVVGFARCSAALDRWSAA